MLMDSALIGLYLLFQLFLGVYLSKFIKSEGDYFLAGRRLPTYAIAFSIFATWFGAETCIGSSAAVFQEGLAGSKAEPIGYGLCLFFTAILIAPRLWNQKYMTLGDFFKERFGVSTEKIAIWIMVPSSLIWAAAQIRAFGQVLSATTTLDVEWGINVATVFVITYTLFGGFLGDVVTDVIQGLILALGLVLLLYFGLEHTGGFLTAWESIPSDKLTFIGSEESFLERIDSWLIPIMGSLVAQELIARVLAADSKRQAIRASYGGTILYLIFGSIPIFIGLIGSSFHLKLDESEQFLPTLAKTILPHWVYIIFAGALISAILSTIDSILLAVSALISHSVLVPTFHIESQKQKVFLARLVLVLSGIVAFVIAKYGDSVYEMVESASSFGTTGILVITLGGLWGKRAKAFSANMTLILGIILSILFEYVLKLPSAFSLNLLIVAAAYLLLSLASKCGLKSSLKG